MQKILLVDDEQTLLDSAALLLKKDYLVLCANSISQAKAIVTNNCVDAAIVDLHFEGQESDGIHFIDWVAENRFNLPIIVLSGDRSTQRVVSAMRKKLVDFIPKSRAYDQDLKLAIRKGLELRKSNDDLHKTSVFRSKSPAVAALLEKVDKIVKSGIDCSILIQGETGTGKEVLAKHISHKSQKHLVAANMASIPKEMAESTLFGHVRGAFTGAHSDNAGLLVQAHQGIFFLDELGECSLALQAKLLRVIQEKEVQPLGSPLRPRKLDIQFVAATNQNLTEMVAQGLFRLDLLQRLNTVVLEIPPLRVRPEDIELYTNLFLEKFTDKQFALRASGLDALLNYAWPGNVRELENLVQKLVIFSETQEITAESVLKLLPVSSVAERKFLEDDLSKLQNRRGDVLQALERAGGNRTRAAELLGIHNATLFRWMKKLGIGGMIEARAGRPSQSLQRETS